MPLSIDCVTISLIPPINPNVAAVVITVAVAPAIVRAEAPKAPGYRYGSGTGSDNG